MDEVECWKCYICMPNEKYRYYVQVQICNTTPTSTLRHANTNFRAKENVA